MIIISMIVKCPKCGYEWNYTGIMFYIQCNRCKKGFKIREVDDYERDSDQ